MIYVILRNFTMSAKQARTCSIKLFLWQHFLPYRNKLVFATVSHFHPSLAVSQPLSAVRGSTVGSSSLACKYKIKMEVTDSNKHLTYHDTARITAVKSFIVQA